MKNRDIQKSELVKLSFGLNDFLLSEHLIQHEISHNALFCIMKCCLVYVKRFFCIFFSNIFKYGLMFRKQSYYKKNYNIENVFFAPTLNNKRALEEIIQNTDHYFLIDNINDINKYPIFQVYVYSLKTFFLVTREFLRLKRSKEKDIIGNTLINYILTVGFYCVDMKICRNTKIRSLIVANDHTNFNRAFIQAAKSNEIVTVYVQHASVASYYPQLNFTYSFLDGLDSLSKYVANDKSISDTTVILLGAARYDKLAKKRKINRRTNYAIGIGINILDDRKKIIDTCRNLSVDFPDYKIIIRAHPNWGENILFDSSNILFTSAYDEPIDVFFSKIDILIANDSCIHLDAIKFQIPSLMYTFSMDGFSDQYDFVKSNLVENIKTYERLRKLIISGNFYFPSDDVIRLFDNSYNKEYEGSVSQMIANLINNGFQDSFYTQLNLEYIIVGHMAYYQIPVC